MQKKKFFSSAVLVIVLFVFSCALFACDKKEDSTPQHTLNLEEGSNPTMLASNFQGDELAKVTAGLQDGATTDAVREAVFVMYNVANRSRRSADTSLMIQHTDGGLLLYGGFEIKSGSAWYYQLPAQALVFQKKLANVVVAYTMDQTTFNFVRMDYLADPKVKEITTFPYSSFELVKQPEQLTFDEFRAKRFFLDDQLELCNMKFSLDLIDATSEIEYDAERHIYTVKLVVNCTLDDEVMREWYLQAFNEGNTYAPFDATHTIRYYNSWYAEMEVWENGYVKSLNYYDDWTSDNPVVSNSSTSNFIFFYYDDEIMAILSQDPKYANLDDEQKAEIVSPLSFVEMYSNAPITKAKIVLADTDIALIALGCIAAAVVAIVVGIEVAVKKGKLPKLAAKREAAKQKRLAKKAAKNGELSESPVDEEPKTQEESEVPTEKTEE